MTATTSLVVAVVVVVVVVVVIQQHQNSTNGRADRETRPLYRWLVASEKPNKEKTTLVIRAINED